MPVAPVALLVDPLEEDVPVDAEAVATPVDVPVEVVPVEEVEVVRVMLAEPAPAPVEVEQFTWDQAASLTPLNQGKQTLAMPALGKVTAMQLVARQSLVVQLRMVWQVVPVYMA